MKLRIGNRLGVEALEDRCVPAVVAVIRFGVLTVSGSSTTPGLVITQTSVGVFTVEDGGANVAISGSGTVRDVFVRLGSSDDTVDIDLGGETLSGGVTASLGRGANDLTVQNGTINRALTVLSGSGDDTVTLAATLTVGGPTSIALDGGEDTFTSDATLNSFLTTAGVDTATVNGSVGRSATFVGDSTGSSVTITGSVGGKVAFTSGFLGLFGGGGPNSLTLEEGAEVGGLVYTGALFGSAADTVTVEDGATVDGSVYVLTGGGDDVVTVGDVAINGTAAFYLGSGADSLTFGGQVEGGWWGQAFYADTGSGNDAVEVTSTAEFGGDGTIVLGSGDDTFEIDSGLELVDVTLRVFGGLGTDTRSDPLPEGVVVFGFEVPPM